MLIEETAKAETRAARKTSGRVRYNKAMKLIRRVHLYSGLFMTPWVFLYGVTAFLFNHPTAFSNPRDRPQAIGPDAIAGTALADLGQPSALAERVVQALDAQERAKGSSASGGGYRLARADEAQYARELLASGRVDDKETSLRLDLNTGSGTVRTLVSAPRPEAAKAAPRKKVDLKPSSAEQIRGGIAEVSKKLNLPALDATPRGRAAGPELRFWVEQDGKMLQASYDLMAGTIQLRPADGVTAAATDVRRFLLNLHVAHGYPSRFDARWVWAVAVDAMFVCMVGWGLTGILMWWQMKNVRIIGVAVLIASVIASVAITMGMHASFMARQ